MTRDIYNKATPIITRLDKLNSRLRHVNDRAFLRSDNQLSEELIRAAQAVMVTKIMGEIDALERQLEAI